MENANQDMRNWYSMGFDSGDPWGSVMHWRFNIADELSRRGAEIPGAWEYRCGACGAPDPEDGEFDFSEVSSADLVAFGDELATEAAALEAAGRSY
jgi:hypothetical protein